MVWRSCFALFLSLTFVVYPLIPQTKKPVTNDDVLAMVKAGFQEETILQTIEVNEARFDTSPSALQALKDAGVSTRILRAIELAMRDRTGAAKPDVETGALPADTGVYVKQGDGYSELQREAVAWPWSGGSTTRGNTTTTHRLATAKGSHSGTQLSPPLELLIVPPQGVSPFEYGLFRAQDESPSKDRRRFRLEVVIVGRDISWNAKRKGVVTLRVESVAARKYRVQLPQLDPGEYAFVPAGRMNEPLGVLHTFGVR